MLSGKRHRRLRIGLPRAAAAVGILMFIGLAFASLAPSTVRAQSACRTSGPRWVHFDAHGGAKPRQDASGRLYQIQTLNYSCALAKAALVKIFPSFAGIASGANVAKFRGAPPGFACRGSVGGPPDRLPSGLCANASRHQLFQWSPVVP